VAHEFPPGVLRGLRHARIGAADDPVIASVGTMPCFFRQSWSRQKPTRMPYSCHDQFGMSGSIGCPMGGGRTVRGIARSMPQSSTFTMVHTTIRAPPGSRSAGRSTIAE